MASALRIPYRLAASTSLAPGWRDLGVCTRGDSGLLLQGLRMNRPTITVVTPTHPARVRNGMLLRAQQSVWAQTLLPDAHAVTYDLDREGAAATRQRALMMANTDFVAFLDSDDFFFADHLEQLMNHQQETGADFVYSWFKIFQETPWGGQLLEHDPIFPSTHFTRPFDPESPIETTITTLVRTELAKEIGFKPLD